MFLILPFAFTFCHNAATPKRMVNSIWFAFNRLQASNRFQLDQELLLTPYGFLCLRRKLQKRTPNEQIRPPSVCVRLFALGSLSPPGVARLGPNRPGSLADPAVHHAHQSHSRGPPPVRAPTSNPWRTAASIPRAPCWATVA